MILQGIKMKQIKTRIEKLKREIKNLENSIR
jgi:polyhydroxyalkanoate synthesis regulator phasin